MTNRKSALSDAALADAVHPKVLKLVVLPTEKCNFRCTYCYEDFSIGRMRPAIVRGIKALVDRRIESLVGVGLSWFGGEPLAAKDILFDLAEHVHKRCGDTGVRNLGGNLTTNGYLLDLGTVERLCEVEQRSAQISLDGLGAVHDCSRPLASGRGTFSQIWDRLLAVRDSAHDFHIQIRVHVGIADLAETAELCAEINRQFGGDKRFTVYFRQIENWGRPQWATARPVVAAVSKVAITELGAILRDVENNAGLDGEPGICYAAKLNTWIIRADGRVGKCTVALEDPRNTIGSLDEDGYLRVDKEMLRPWAAGFPDLDAELLSCPYIGVQRSPEPKTRKILMIVPATGKKYDSAHG